MMHCEFGLWRQIIWHQSQHGGEVEIVRIEVIVRNGRIYPEQHLPDSEKCYSGN